MVFREFSGRAWSQALGPRSPGPRPRPGPSPSGAGVTHIVSPGLPCFTLPPPILNVGVYLRVTDTFLQILSCRHILPDTFSQTRFHWCILVRTFSQVSSRLHVLSSRCGLAKIMISKELRGWKWNRLDLKYPATAPRIALRGRMLRAVWRKWTPWRTSRGGFWGTRCPAAFWETCCLLGDSLPRCLLGDLLPCS